MCSSDLSDVSLEVTSKGVQHAVDLKRVQLRTEPPMSRQFLYDIELTLEQASSFTANGRVELLESGVLAEGDLNLTAVSLAQLQEEVPVVLAGTLSHLSTPYEVRLEEGRFSVQLEPDLALSQIELSDPISLSLSSLSWKGPVSLEQQKIKMEGSLMLDGLDLADIAGKIGRAHV